MVRDHLLGCQAFLPPEPDHFIHLQKVYALGIPQRVGDEFHDRFEKHEVEMNRLADFETADHTPEAMRKDFPHEYDFQTLLLDAEIRAHYRDSALRRLTDAECEAFSSVG